MSEKKRSEKIKKTAYKVIAVIAGILFVVLMVVSSMGSSWISGLAVVKPGDVVVVDYTVWDAQGNPIMTSNQQTYLQATNGGYWLLGSKQLSVTANQTLNVPLYPVQVVTPDRQLWQQYAFLGSEYNTISHAIVGMRVNDAKKINMNAGVQYNDFLSNEQMAKLKINLTNVGIGENIVLPITETPTGNVTNSSATQYLRIMQVVEKSPEGITLSYNIPNVEIRVVSINPRTSS